MDGIVSSALDEICAEGPSGTSLPELWPMLQPCVSSAGLDVCDGYVRASIWKRLLGLRGIRFEGKGSVALDPRDPSIQSVEDAEKNRTRVVAEKRVRHAFLGISEMLAAGRDIPELQIRLLERVARARTNGVTQADLSKEFKKKPRDFFYYLRVVESCGLVVRQQTILKYGIRNTCTNTVYFHRYAKHVNLSSTQRVEIRRGDRGCDDHEERDGSHTAEDGSDVGAHTSKDEVCLKDFLPALEAICNRLEQASGKVLVVSDLKKELGYRHKQGHRSWRHMVRTLTQANLVEVFRAKLSEAGKLDQCMRLLKKFNPRDFQPKATRYTADHAIDNNETENYNISEQVVELPIDHQIYDMVDAQGLNGISIIEICRRLGLNTKKNYSRIVSLCSRFGMHLRSKQVNKTMTCWVWTAGNMKDCLSSACDVGNPDTSETYVPNNLTGELTDSFSEKASSVQAGLMNDISHSEDSRAIVPHFDMNVEETVKRIELNCYEDVSSTTQTSKSHPCLDTTVVSWVRKQRILSRLEKEKFVLQVDLHKWLASLETDKPTKMDRRTLLRILEKLEHENQCKFINISFPSFTNLSSGRTEVVVLHPQVTNLPDLLGKIHEKVRDFDYISRSQKMSQAKSDNQSTTVLENVERLSSDLPRSSNVEAMLAGGFIPPRMVRAKLLHMFLWSHLNETDMEINYKHNLLQPLNLKAAIDAMPVELFLQVAGSERKVDDLIGYCQQGLRLSDLPIREYKCLIDTPATCRLSSIVDILIRLKLICLVSEDSTVDTTHVVLTHTMELKPYIEHPRGRGSFDHRPRLRHDFDLSSSDSVDAYWYTLEDCYSTADPDIASHAFPGSAVPEVFSRRSWSTLRVMTMEQRVKLLKHITNNYSSKTSSRDCIKIARELKLTPDQVLRLSYHMQLSHKLSSECSTDGHEILETSARKRKCSPVSGREIDIGCIKKPLLKLDGKILESETSVGNNSDGSMSENVAELEAENEDEENHDIIRDCTFSILNPTRRRSLWNDEMDRQLIMQYAKYRVIHGAHVHRVDWHSLPDLPASPKSCRKRLAYLRSSTPVRDAVMSACNVLSESYTKFLDDTSNEGFKEHDISTEISPSPHVSNMDLHLARGSWDNFEDPKIKMAINNVLQCNRLHKLGISSENGFGMERKFTNNCPLNVADSVAPASSDRERDYSVKSQEGFRRVSVSCLKRVQFHHVPGKFFKLLNGTSYMGITKQVADSLSLSNAVELIKLVFLSSSETTEVQTFLVETLKQYAKSDILAAVTYLKEKHFLVPGHGNRPFVLSQKFINDVSSSPYPFDTGRRSAKFSSLIHNGKEDLVIDGLDFPLDLQCGEILHLFALATLDEVTFSICIPNDGVGDVDDPNSLKQNEKLNDDDEVRKNEVFWMKDNEFCLRREKGFPGIKVAVDHTCSKSDCTDLLKNSKTTVRVSLSKCSQEICSTSTDHSSTLESSQELFDSCLKINLSGSLWQAMADYTHRFLPHAPKGHTITSLIRSVYIVVKQSGEQGLSIQELAEVVDIQENVLIEILTDTLVAFKKVVKVNAYDSVHVIDSAYKLKYYIPVLPANDKNLLENPCTKRRMLKRPHIVRVGQKKNIMLSQGHIEIDMSICSGHKVSILDLPEETGIFEGMALPSACSMEDEFHTNRSQCLARPILPWIGGDGSTNNVMYKGLVRRILGTIMQNPGILEEDLITNIDVLNPQSCRQLLELLILDNHVTVRKIHHTPLTPPVILQQLVKSNTQKSAPLFRKHLFANPLSTHLL